jgi:hypothetical protein
VADNDTGIKQTPTGSVMLAPSTQALLFSSLSCTSAGSPSYTMTCTGNVTGKDDFHSSVAANYSGDAVHTANAGSASLDVNNLAPVITGVAADPVIYTSSVNINVSFTDVGVLDTHTCTFTGPVTPGPVTHLPTGGGSCTAVYPASPVGVYPVTVTVSDDDGGSTPLLFYAVFYDPNAGFVTGGGWINSPTGAYPANPSLAGKGTFGFVSKYQKGANVPDGNTEFQFQAAGMNFKSTSYDYLVVQGQSKAQYKGNGTINGNGDYKFLVSVVDGNPDRFRIKITQDTTLIYDNMLGVGDDATVTGPATALGGGSIVIHN